MTLLTLLDSLEKARKDATDVYSEKALKEILEGRTSKINKDAKFIFLSHNEILKLITAAREMEYALEAIANGATWAGNEYGCRQTAKDALTKVNSITVGSDDETAT